MSTSKYRFTALAASLLALAPLAQASEWSVDPAHSHVGFRVRHLVSHVNGDFQKFNGTFKFDEKKPTDSSVEFVAEAASINTDNAKRDGHLRSPDFFDVEKYPELKFVSKKFYAKGKGKFKLEGELTMHGVTKPATFDVEYHGAQKDPFGGKGNRSGFTATTKLNRKDYGLTWNKTLETGGLMVGDDVEVTLDVEATEKTL